MEFDNSDSDENFELSSPSKPKQTFYVRKQVVKVINQSSHETESEKHTCNQTVADETGKQQDIGGEIKESGGHNARKRVRDPKSWVKENRKRLRNGGQEYKSTSGKVVRSKCVQPTACTCHYKCSDTIPQEKREDIFHHYWSLDNYDRQRDYIRTNTFITESKYKIKDSRRQNTIQYFLTIGNVKQRVCKRFFLQTLDIGERVVSYTLKNKQSFKQDL